MHFLLHRRMELRAGIKGRKQSTAGGGRSQREGSCEAVCRAANLRILFRLRMVTISAMRNTITNRYPAMMPNASGIDEGIGVIVLYLRV